MYLSSNYHPDITFTVHQCTHFTHHPRKSHEEAVKWIVQYLYGMKDKELILHEVLQINCFIDA